MLIKLQVVYFKLTKFGKQEFNFNENIENINYYWLYLIHYVKLINKYSK